MEPYLYQQTILGSAVRNNCLVVLPTGMGKTFIAVLLSIQRQRDHPNSKILVLAPTKPLAEQQMRAFNEHLDNSKSVLFTGSVSPKKRQELFKESTFIFSTPQGLENDIMSGRIDLTDVSLIVFDEAHRAVGNYSYVFIAKMYQKKAKYPRIMALTASPGSDTESIREVCTNLFIDEVEIRTVDDPDVKPYTSQVDIKWVKVDLPEQFLSLKKTLENIQKSKLEQVKELGFLNSVDLSKTQLLKLQGQMHGSLARGERDFDMMKSISLLAEAMKIAHASELLESQGIIPLSQYMEQLEQDAVKSKVKATKNLVKDLNFRVALQKTRDLVRQKVEHPKMPALHGLLDSLNTNDESKVIVFTQFRDTARVIVDDLKAKGIRARLFVGQAKKNGVGLGQKKQIEMLNDFRNSKFNILVATSVAEEGLDIPKVDAVIFYEPVPSAIRTIQRRGRTGRGERGQTYILMAKNTRDEGYRWSAHHKEKRMVRILQSLRNNINLELKSKSQKNLADFSAPSSRPKLLIIADSREKGNKALRLLAEEDVVIKMEQLKIADYVLSSRVGIEFKTVEDFVDSLIDGRLLEQVSALKGAFERPVLIIEGSQDIYSIRKVHPNAISGMLSAIAVDFGVPILYSKDHNETARLMLTIAKREQEFSIKQNSSHFKKPRSLSEQQEYSVSALPSVGPVVSKRLLKRFGSVKNVINAPIEQLKQVDLVGDKKAEELKRFIDAFYKES